MFGNALVDAFKDMLETGWTSSNHAVLHQTQRQRQFSALEEQPFDILSRAYVLDLQDACTKIYKAYTDPMPGTDFQPAQSEKINAATLW